MKKILFIFISFYFIQSIFGAIENKKVIIQQNNFLINYLSLLNNYDLPNSKVTLENKNDLIKINTTTNGSSIISFDDSLFKPIKLYFEDKINNISIIENNKTISFDLLFNQTNQQYYINKLQQIKSLSIFTSIIGDINVKINNSVAILNNITKLPIKLDNGNFENIYKSISHQIIKNLKQSLYNENEKNLYGYYDFENKPEQTQTLSFLKGFLNFLQISIKKNSHTKPQANFSFLYNDNVNVFYDLKNLTNASYYSSSITSFFYDLYELEGFKESSVSFLIDVLSNNENVYDFKTYFVELLNAANNDKKPMIYQSLNSNYLCFFESNCQFIAPKTSSLESNSTSAQSKTTDISSRASIGVLEDQVNSIQSLLSEVEVGNPKTIPFYSIYNYVYTYSDTNYDDFIQNARIDSPHTKDSKNRCVFQDSKNRFFDLSPTSNVLGSSQYTTINGSKIFYFSLCEASTLCTATAGEGPVQSCVSVGTTTYTTGITPFSHVQFFDNGLTIQYQSGKIDSTTCTNQTGYHRISNFILTCDTTQNYAIKGFVESSPCVYDVKISTKFACPIENKYLFGSNQYDLRSMKLESSSNPYSSTFELDRFLFNLGGSVDVCTTFSGLSGKYYGCLIFGLEKTTIPFSDKPTVSKVPFIASSNTSNNILISFSSSSTPTICTTKPEINIYIRCSNTEFTVLTIVNNSNCNQTIYASSKNACPLAYYEYFGSNPYSSSTLYAQVFDFSPLQNRTINGSIEYLGLSIGNVYSSYYHNFGIQPVACPADNFACQILNHNKNTYPLGKTQYYQYSANSLSIKSYGLSTHGDCPSSGYKRTLKLSFTCNKTENYKVTSYSENPMCTYNLNVQSRYACQQTVSALYHNVLLDNYIDLRPLKTISSGNYQFLFGSDTVYFNMGGDTLRCMTSGVAYQSCINLTVPFGSIESQQFKYQSSGIDIIHTYTGTPNRKFTLQLRCNTLYPFLISSGTKTSTEISIVIYSEHACTKTFSQIYPNSPALKNPCEYTCRTPQRAYTVNSITHVLLSGGVCGGEFQSNYTDIQLSTLFSQYWYDNKIPSDWTTGQFYNLLFTNSAITKQILSKFVTKTKNNYCSYISYTGKFKTFSSILDQSIDLRKFANQSIHRQVDRGLTVTHTPHPTSTTALGLTIISINNKTCVFLETTLANAFTSETIRNCQSRDYCRYNCTGITQNDLDLLNVKNDLNSTLLTIGVCPNELSKYNTTTFAKVIKFFEKRWVDNPIIGNWRSGQFYEYLKLTNVVSKINILSKYVDSTTRHYVCTYTSTLVKPKNSFEDIKQITFDLFKLALKNKSTRKSYTNFDTYFAPSKTNSSFGLSMVFVNFKICSFIESSIQDFQSGRIITSCPIGPIVDDVTVKSIDITVNARFCPNSTYFRTLFAYVGSTQASISSMQRNSDETCILIFKLSSLTMGLQNKRIKIYNEYSKNIYESLYQRNILYYFKLPIPTVTKITYSATNPKYNSLITVTGENFLQATDSKNGLFVKIGETNVTSTITSLTNTLFYINAIGAGSNYISFYYFNNLKMNIKSGVVNYFTFENVIISSLSKTTGKIGDLVTVNGQNFFNGSTNIYFGSEIAEITKFTSDKIIEVIVPPGFYTVDVFAVNTGMNASTASIKFTYPSMIIDKLYYDDKHLNTSEINQYWIVGRGLGSIVEEIPEATVDDVDSYCEIQSCTSDVIANSKIDYSNICPYLKSQYAYYSTDFDLYLCSFPINVGANRTIQVTLANNARYTYKYSYSLPWLSEFLTANSSDTHGGNCSRLNCVTPPQKPQYLNITGFNFNPFEFISPFYDSNKTIASWRNTSRIYIGTFECGSVQWINSTNVSCIIPPGIGANLKVNITIGEQKSENQLLFSYNKPNITNKITVSTDGATDIKYVGFNFVPAELKDFYNKEENKNVSVNSITINGKTQYKDIKWINSTSFSFNPVAGIGKNHSVVLLVGGQKSNETRSFSYNPPSLDNKQYAAPSSGGKTITIKGYDFVPKSLKNSVNSSNGTVSINGVLCANWEWVDSKNVKCTVPPGKGKGLPIRVNVQSQLNSLNNYFSYVDPESPTNIVIFIVIGLAALVAAALLASTALPLTQIALATSATAAKSGSILASTASFSGALEKSLQFGFAAVTRRVVTQVAKNGIKRVSTIALAMVVTKSSMGGNLLSSSTAPVPTFNLLSIASTPYSAVFFSINHNDRIFTIDNQFNETVTCIDNNNLSFNFNKSFTCQINANNNGIKCNTTNFGTEINCGVRSKSASYKFSIPTVSKVSSSLKCEYDANEKSMIIYGQNSPIYCKDGFNEYTYNHNSTIFCSNSETQSNIVECVSDGGEPEHSFINNVECYNYNKYSSCSKNSLVKASDYSACFEVPPSEVEPIVITNQTIITEFNSASSKLACYPKEVEFNYAYNNTLICYNVKSGSIDYSDSILHQIQYKVKVCIEKE
ncbi:hypothetical protein DDB_G0291065 [Dictyostelium discoideum AX4]|uniref:MRH domain-containing protein n=1 Tax=Dictyostelium discoideum TaxID=44689 RepID=Q54F71_DICDI|nr:hypothetical protein DDB_G0291065 [Dictyostelium discoideum AX4]EAL61963.1 hypothetical protein DDB_G0291065 [Dictyostelium discoideum AX4]|eukprot:XP_635466.1 hypothetical protein DDB_G0291065 [Dictyostelium discoideum AX4]